MGLFDNRKARRPSGGGESDSTMDQLADVRAEVPDIDDTLERVERGITEPMEELRRGGCACWG